MEMCGLEFCGNASRSYGLIRAHEMGICGEGKVFIDISGCNEILTVDVNTETGFTKVKMPLPVSMTEFDLSKLPIDDLKVNPMAEMLLRRASLVNFDGIVHVVLSDIQAKPETFELIKDVVMEKYNPPAIGVMFCDSRENKMIPVVYVRDVDTTYFEGSCGSGTTACAAAFGTIMGDGTHNFSFPQPAGTIDSTVEIYKGKYIYYSLANFCFGGNMNPSDKDTVIVSQSVRLENGIYADSEVQIIPCSVSSKSYINDYRPTEAKGNEKSRIIERMNALCDEFSLCIDDNGFVNIDL
jgi:diaminopimelate epimerase